MYRGKGNVLEIKHHGDSGKERERKRNVARNAEIKKYLSQGRKRERKGKSPKKRSQPCFPFASEYRNTLEEKNYERKRKRL